MTNPSHQEQPPQAEWDQLQKMIEAVAGIDMKELLDDSEKRVTYFEVTQTSNIAWSRYEKTGDKKYLRTAIRADSLLKEMYKKAGEGKFLYLKPSELSNLLHDQPTE